MTRRTLGTIGTAVVAALAAGVTFFAAGGASSALAYPGADNLYAASQSCSADGTVSVAFGWTGYGFGQQWLDLSSQNNGFAPGTYTSQGPIYAPTYSTTWSGLASGQTYLARVDTQTQGGLVLGNTVVFTTQACAPAVQYYPPAVSYTPSYTPAYTYPPVINYAPAFVPAPLAHPPLRAHFTMHHRRPFGR
jgi:hypothetical protein